MEKSVSAKVDIKFPVSLDSESVKFTIFDTPGTDSNYNEHREVLREAQISQRSRYLFL